MRRLKRLGLAPEVVACFERRSLSTCKVGWHFTVRAFVKLISELSLFTFSPDTHAVLAYAHPLLLQDVLVLPELDLVELVGLGLATVREVVKAAAAGTSTNEVACRSPVGKRPGDCTYTHTAILMQQTHQ